MMQMKTHLFGVGDLNSGFLTLGSASNNEGESLRFRAAGVASELSGRVQFHANLQELNEIGVVACMVTCERSELPQKVWVSARVEEGRITGLGKTDLQGSEVMGVLGGVLNDLVLFIDPILPIGKAAVKSAVKKKNAKKGAPEAVKNVEPRNGLPEDAPLAVGPPDSRANLTTLPPGDVKSGEEDEVGKGNIRPLHDRVEVLSPHAQDPFPCTSSRIPILDSATEDKGKTAKGRKKKQTQEAGSSPEKSNGETGVQATEAEDPEAVEGINDLNAPLGTDASLHIDPNLMLKGENGDDIADRELLF